MIPRLPPKQLMLDSLLEDRRRNLQKWLRIMSQHPLMSIDEIFRIFLTDQAVEYQQNMLEVFDRQTDELLHVSPRLHFGLGEVNIVAICRDQMRTVLNLIFAFKRLIVEEAKRKAGQTKDFLEMSQVVSSIRDETVDSGLDEYTRSFLKVSEETEKACENQFEAVKERLEMLIDILIAHSDMCDRVEKTNSKTTNDKQPADIEASSRRKAFIRHCVEQETRFAKKYLKLLPSILLQYCNEEAKVFTKISEIFNQIIQNESDKLN
jgi:sorting nexin-8